MKKYEIYFSLDGRKFRRKVIAYNVKNAKKELVKEMKKRFRFSEIRYHKISFTGIGNKKDSTFEKLKNIFNMH